MSTKDQNNYRTDLTTRKCRKCGNVQMTCQSRRVDFLSVKSLFVCPNCEAEVTLHSGGAKGVHFAIGMLAAGFLPFILWGSRGGYTGIVILKTLGLIAFLTSPFLWATLIAQLYPITGTRSKTVQEEAAAQIDSTTDDLLKKGIASMDKLSPFRTFWAVLFFVALFLGVASLIGWINFTFFDDQLFG